MKSESTEFPTITWGRYRAIQITHNDWTIQHRIHDGPWQNFNDNDHAFASLLDCLLEDDAENKGENDD